MILHTLIVNGRRTSLRMEAEVWEALEEIAGIEGRTLRDLVCLIDRDRGDASLTDSVKVYLLRRYREILRERSVATLQMLHDSQSVQFQPPPAPVQPPPPPPPLPAKPENVLPAFKKVRLRKRKKIATEIKNALRSPRSFIELKDAMPGVSLTTLRGVLKCLVRAGEVTEQLRKGRSQTYVCLFSGPSIIFNDATELSPNLARALSALPAKGWAKLIDVRNASGQSTVSATTMERLEKEGLVAISYVPVGSGLDRRVDTIRITEKGVHHPQYDPAAPKAAIVG
ncbi:ribbon-helix-helix domain-containing protein [Azospirillum sp. Vi22]|uniref:ribbon-helix-helix domain-containing protein n=1 Tax=Azospirillum baldaniorum TaxID=1064539 RepID=UPI00157B96BE|nr:ribbon-helix-helix domain-containing protein [Azospirillum baldaniorum]NUB05810.1 ribbon-helix-helix domain-containing protein [Azospirillum baldaniorum]